MISLDRKVIESALQGARNVYPNEFIALFRGAEKPIAKKNEEKNVEITELIIPPFSDYSAHSSGFNPWHLPLSIDIIGSFHSHPSGRGEPSQQDLNFFSTNGVFHVIAFPPFTSDSFRAYNSKGKPIPFKVR